MTNNADDGDPRERRKFSRVTFKGKAQLRQGDKEWEVTLLDLSLKGLLVVAPGNWIAELSEPFEATIKLGEATVINMTLSWRHGGNGKCGFICEHIDIESITHLRRLVELNLGDPDLLEREFAALGF